MADLTEGQIWVMKLARRHPVAGAPMGSNLWPYMQMKKDDGSMGCDGIEIDDLLRRGLLDTKPLPKAVVAQESKNPEIPDAVATVHIMLTGAGLAALYESEGKDW